jgi:predicted enzyme related to lactoylglutathione lyase
MKKYLSLILVITISFYLGFIYNAAASKRKYEAQIALKRVTGIGGIFFKCKDPKQMRAWYQKHLGLNTNAYGAVFEWRQGADTTQKGFLQWSPFNEKTKYFAPSTKDYMINYRVANLTALVAALKEEGVAITDTIETFEYGKFVHILDAEGNKLELWEPNDKEFEKLGLQIGATTTK